MRTLARLCLLAAAGGAAMAGTNVHDAAYTAFAPMGVSTLADKNGPIGANNPKGGATGVLWLVESDADVADFADEAKAPHTSYIAYISQVYLAENKGAIASLAAGDVGDKLSGIVIFDETPGAASFAQWSAGNTRPNAGMGGTEGWTLTPDAANPNGGGYCTDAANAVQPCGGAAAATGLHWLNVGNRPIFLATGENATEIRGRINNTQTEWPLTGMQLDFFQWTGNSNAETCLRRGNCQALGGRSPYGFLKPYEAGQKIIVVAATLDAVSLFHDLSYGASATGAGMVAAIAVADALRTALGSQANREAISSNVLFVLFQGEEFGYIGSTALNAAIAEGNFPSQDEAMQPEDITHYIELGNVFTNGSAKYQMWSRATGNGADDIQHGLNTANSNIAVADATSGMPPCSMMGFLPNATVDGWTGARSMSNAVLITNEDGQAGDYFQTRYDNADYLGVTNSSTTADAVVANLATLAGNVATAVLGALGSSDSATADAALVLSMLQALEVEQTTPVSPGQWDLSMGTTVSGAARAGVSPLKAGPMIRYVSVFSTSSTSRSISEVWSGTVLATALRVEATPTVYAGNYETGVPCTAPEAPAAAWTVFARGFNSTHMACFLTSGDRAATALSPAFLQDGTTISLVAPWGGLSTWTESTWDSGEIANYFLMADPSQGNGVLAGGIVYFLCCLIAVWWVNARVAVPAGNYSPGAANSFDSPSTPNEAFER